MLRKLLKYDIRAIFKYWWIIALTSVGISFVGGISLKIITNEINSTATSAWINILAFLGMFVCIIGLSGFLIATEIFIYVRVYQNLFSDEGYLTFTLPVKRRDVLNSKLISGVLMNLVTLILLAFDILVVALIGVGGESVSLFFKSLWMFVSNTADLLRILSLVYAIEIILLVLCAAVASFLITFICITIASVVAKKHKIFAAIGFYYAAGVVISFVSQFGMIFGSVCLAGIFSAIPEKTVPAVLSLIILALVAFAGALTTALYSLEHYLLDKKLNLS